MRDGWRIAAIIALAVFASAGIAGYFAMQPPETGPRDGRAWVLAAREKMRENRFAEAAEAYEKGIAASRKVAADPQVRCELADAVGMTQGGRLEGRPAAIIRQAMSISATHACVLEMAGSVAYEAGDYATARRYWEPLLAQLPPASGAYLELSSAIERTRALEGRAPS